MEWYWIAAIIAGFIGLIIGFYFLRKKGIVNTETLMSIKQLVDGIKILVGSVDAVVGNNATKIFDTIVGLLQKAVYAAENAWYNDEIKKEERKAKCLEIFDQLLKANNIELPPAIELVLDSLIAAICEEMGHTYMAEENDSIGETAHTVLL